MDNIILSPIKINDLLDQVRSIIREELNGSTPQQSEIIDRKELCKRLGMSAPTIRLWQKKGKIPFLLVGGNIRYDWQKVAAKIESKRKRERSEDGSF